MSLKGLQNSPLGVRRFFRCHRGEEGAFESARHLRQISASVSSWMELLFPALFKLLKTEVQSLINDILALWIYTLDRIQFAVVSLCDNSLIDVGSNSS